MSIVHLLEAAQPNGRELPPQRYQRALQVRPVGRLSLTYPSIASIFLKKLVAFVQEDVSGCLPLSGGKAGGDLPGKGINCPSLSCLLRDASGLWAHKV